MGRGASSKAMRCHNRAMARGNSTSGNSRAQGSMRPGYKASKLRREQIDDVNTTILVDSIKYIVSYKADTITGGIIINCMFNEKTYQGMKGNKATYFDITNIIRGGAIPIETQHKIGRALCERLSARSLVR